MKLGDILPNSGFRITNVATIPFKHPRYLSYDAYIYSIQFIINEAMSNLSNPLMADLYK